MRFPKWWSHYFFYYFFSNHASYILTKYSDFDKISLVCYSIYMKNEIWKKLEEIKCGDKVLKFEGYEVSNLGRVRTYKKKYGRVSKADILSGVNRPLNKDPYFIKGRPDKKGYYQLCLSDINKKRYNIRVHMVVMNTFVGLPDKGLVVCHNNDIKTDNRLENLRYDTQKSNLEDRKRNKKNIQI